MKGFRVEKPRVQRNRAYFLFRRSPRWRGPSRHARWGGLSQYARRERGGTEANEENEGGWVLS